MTLNVDQLRTLSATLEAVGESTRAGADAIRKLPNDVSLRDLAEAYFTAYSQNALAMSAHLDEEANRVAKVLRESDDALRAEMEGL